MRYEITSPFPNFNVCTVEVWECITSFISHLVGHVVTYLSMLGLKLIYVSERAQYINATNCIDLYGPDLADNINRLRRRRYFGGSVITYFGNGCPLDLMRNFVEIKSPQHQQCCIAEFFKIINANTERCHFYNWHVLLNDPCTRNCFLVQVYGLP